MVRLAEDRRSEPFLEREHELAQAARLLERVGDGDGAILVLEGAAGAGKSRLLTEIAARADQRALTVLSGRGAELERGFPFGLIRQALEPGLARMAADERTALLSGAAAPAAAVLAPVPAGGSPEAYTTLNGLYWLLAALAERNPLLLALDDIHWADEPSLRFLSFLAGRLDSVAALVTVATRPRSGEPSDGLVGSLAAHAETTTLRLRGLGPEAVREVVARRLGDTPHDAFVRACLVSSGGNPFLLVELLNALRGAAVTPTEQNARHVAAVSPENVTRSVAARLERGGQDAATLARALAAVGDGATLALTAQVADLGHAAARDAADVLATAGLIAADTPLRFAHPLLRSAVEATLTPGERLRLHGRAATLLDTAGAPPERVALHLLQTEPRGDARVAALLAEAGRSALQRGAPDLGARLMHRALDEPPAADERVALLFDLGIAEAAVGSAAAQEHLRAVVDTAGDPVLRGSALRELTWVTGPRPEALADLLPLYERVIADVEQQDRELALGLQAARLGALFLTPGAGTTFEREADRFVDLPGDTPAECAVLAWAARKASLTDGTAGRTAALAERAARHPTLPDAGPSPVWVLHLVLALIIAERFETAERVLAASLARAVEQGSASAFASVSAQRALVRHAAGDLRGCEADARAAIDSRGMSAIYPFQSLIPLVESLADQGKTDEGEALLRDAGLDAEMPPARPYTALLIARGRLRAAAGDLARAHDDLGEALRRLAAAGAHGVIGLDGRLAAALVAHAVGDAGEARRQSDEALAAARAWQGPRALGGALRVAGLLRGGAEGLELLREAEATLATSPARLWHAHALVDLGAALRRANRRRDSREPLRRGLEIAEDCGALPLAERARRELQAGGGRVPVRAGGGAGELTPSELRVAELAAGGLTNPQIAQQLFVTIKTVEMHLSSSYRKLAIAGRGELAGALNRA